jgi:hypothetical protein
MHITLEEHSPFSKMGGEDTLEGFPTMSREQAEAFLELALHAVLAEEAHARPA